MVKPAVVRFYFDEDLLGLARIVGSLRSDCTYPGDPGAEIHKRTRPPSPVSRGSKDPVWLPTVSAAGWLIVSRDLNIKNNIAERRAVRDHGGRMVALSGEDAKTRWSQLELFMVRWRKIEALLDEPGPFIYRASRTIFTAIDLDA